MARIGTFLAVGLLLLVLSFPLLSGLIAPMVPDSVQGPVGEEMIKSAAREHAFCHDPDGIAALQSLVDRIATAGDEDRTYRVYVSNGDVLNAFAAPGGHIVIYRAIIERAESPDEVAGVLAHEMGHVMEDHPAKGLIEAMGYGVFGLLTWGAGKETPQVAQTLLTNHYSREDELDADRVGVHNLNQAGIDSRGLISFFDKLSDAGADMPGALEFLSTHPSGDKRADSLSDIIREGKPALDEAQWAALQGVCKTTGAPDPIVVTK
jgi:predicted Zn-dependent protease